MSSDSNLMELLDNWVRGDHTALDRLTPLVYPQLRSLASMQLRNGKRSATMQTTVVVNELFLKLLAHRPARVESRQHFYALAAKMIRTALVDHYRQIRAEKRGGGIIASPLA
jgi:RNA polymerase sigma factor (TIGR02999 family)